MLAKITLEKFFSFGEPTTIELNPGVNILVGINGSGKTNFIRAIQLLYESIVGGGFENLFINHWKGYSSVVNFCSKGKEFIKLRYEFDKEVINGNSKNDDYHFESNPVYEMKIIPYGNEYIIEERCYAPKDILNYDIEVFLEYSKEKKKILMRNPLKQRYDLVDIDNDNSITRFEPVLRQISHPKKQATNSQLIIATHSPLLLNAFDLDDLIVFEKDQDNQSIRKSLESDDYEEWIEKYLVGQLWLNGQIGGKRW
jgi:predicted ATPase